MNQLPVNLGPIHIVGIGGIGMSGIAEVLLNLGYTVQGSDMSNNANVERLKGIGATIHIGHAAENVGDAAVVVISSAVKPSNVEVVEARSREIPVVRRAEMLAELMRLRWAIAVAGTHGKTTTTSLIAAILDAASLDPTVINGGIINAYGTNARLGEGEWMVVEADESDGTFTRLPNTAAVVTNIDPEHLDHYGSFDNLKAAFRTFIETVPFYGFAALCIDHPEVQKLKGEIQDRRIITYGLTNQADITVTALSYDMGAAHFDVRRRDPRTGDEDHITGLSLPMPGNHNVSNALAAISVATALEIPTEQIKAGLAKFEGVKRRFTHAGQSGGVTVIDDYAHHPVEIASVLSAARQAFKGQVIGVMQPHRYSRLKSLFDDFCTSFNDADIVIVTPVFEAGETPIEGADRDALVEALKAHGHRHVIALEDEDALAPLIRSLADEGDGVICMGAGSISAWAHRLPAALDALNEKAGGA